jgi:hypothetical protein
MMTMEARKRQGARALAQAFIALLVFGAGLDPLRSDERSPGAVNPVGKQTLQSLSAISQRPLFAPTRRPFEPEPPAPPPAQAPEPQAPPPNVTLVGVVKDPRELQALLRLGEKDFHVRIGDDLSGWTVSDIGARSLVLTLGARSVSLALFPEKSPSSGSGLGMKRRGGASDNQ